MEVLACIWNWSLGVAETPEDSGRRIAIAAVVIAEGCNSFRTISTAIRVSQGTVSNTPEIVKMLDAAGGLRPEVDSDAAEEFRFESRKAR